jgi:glycosyltransferase involved in cell wall biosynthesis
MKQELISVVIPCYNYARFLTEAVKSIQQQTYTHWECLIVNDGSTDDSLQVAQTLAANNSRIRVIDQKNQGLSAARNAGILAASGDFIQLLDADDLLVANKFETQLLAFRANENYDVVYGDYVLLDDAQQRYYRKKTVSTSMTGDDAFLNFCQRWEKGFTIPIHSYLFRSTCFKNWGLFTVELPTHEDVDLQLRFALHHARYHHEAGIVAVYRQHGKSMVTDLTRMHRGYLQSLHSLQKHPNATGKTLAEIRKRYTQEFLEALLNKLRGKKLRFTEVIAGGGAWNVWAVLLLPLNLIRRVNDVFSNRKKAKALTLIHEEFPHFKIFT